MAYTWSKHFNGADGKKAAESGYEFDAVYRVITDDPQDQSERVLAYFTNTVLDIGSPYVYANDAWPLSVAKSIRCKRERGSTDVWVVTVHYARPDTGDREDEEFIEDDLPIRCEDVTMHTVQHQRPVERAIFRGGFHGDALVKVPLGTETIPKNSVYTPFNPGLEKDVAGVSIRLVRRLATVDGTSVKDAMNSVNSDAFSIDHCNFTMSVDKYQARITSGALALRSEDGKKYWELPLILEVIDEGWRPEVADRGVVARADAGDDDGRGGTISASDLIPGVPRVRRLVDGDETPISDPVLLDGNGQPLDPGEDTVWLTWQTYLKEVDFKTIDYLSGFVV